jgi:hypothetical protein
MSIAKTQIALDITISTEKNSSSLAAEPGLDTGHDASQMGFHDLVIGIPPLFLAFQKTTPLHKSQMLRGHMARNAARLCQFPDRISSLKQHLDHPKPMGMSEGL